MSHSGNIGSWGSGPWGSGSWGGGGSGGVLTLLGVLAVRENVFRLEFSTGVYFSTILDPDDASIPEKYTVAPVAGTFGLDGNPARPLLVAEVLLPIDLPGGVPEADVGRFVDIVTDRPMTPWPAMYDVTLTDVHSFDLLASIASETRRVPAVYKRVAPPTVDSNTPTRDIANAQTRSAALESLPDPNNPIVLGTIQVDDAGDYAFDEGATNLKKRIIRRLVTRPGAFAHLPNYGVGVPDHGKRLALSSVVADLAAAAEAQIALEPEVARVRVVPVVDPNTPGLVRFRVLVKPRSGQSQRFDVPFPTTA